MADDETETDDFELFREQMAGISPIKPANRVSLKQPPRKAWTGETNFDDTENSFAGLFSDAPDYEECPDILNFARSGVQHTVLKRLRQGKLPIESVLDLHGLTVQQARAELIDFLHDCELMELRHVIIVHGKGYRSKNKPVIKPMINRWLRVAPGVLAFHTALPEDGGGGAVYVLLKKAPQK